MEFDSAYRRGTVFGLTIAEICILLIFLILLALLGLVGNWREKEKEFRAERDAPLAREQRLFEWRDIIEFHTPDEIRTLHSKATALEQQINSSEELIRKDGVPGHERQTLHEEMRTLRREDELLREENKALREEREELATRTRCWSNERIHWMTRAKRCANLGRTGHCT